jgi:hypothetical protein
MKTLDKAAFVLLLCAVLVPIGAFSNGWRVLTNDPLEARIGLREVETCYRGKCETETFEGKHAEMYNTDAPWMVRAGRFAFWLGLATMAACAVSGFAILGGRRKLGVPVVMVSSLLATLWAVGYLLAIPDKLSEPTKIGVVPFVYMIGTLVAFIAALVAYTAPVDPDALAEFTATAAAGPPPAFTQGPRAALPSLGTNPSPVPACPQCRAPTAWIREQQRYHCASCKLDI